MNELLRQYLEEDGEKPNIVITNVYRCSRCKQDHTDVLFKVFTDPVEDNDGKLWEWYALCPTNKEPILLSGKVSSTSVYNLTLKAIEIVLKMIMIYGDKTGEEVSFVLHDALKQIKKVIG